MDFEGADDSPMTAFISFPQVLGHEVVATVEDAGPDAGRRAGPAGRAQPVAVVRGAGHRPAVPGVRGRRPQPVLALPRRRPRARHPHRQLGRRHRRLRRAAPGPPPHADPGARRRRPTRSPCSPTRSRSRCTPSPATRRRRAVGPSSTAPARSARAPRRSCGRCTPTSRSPRSRDVAGPGAPRGTGSAPRTFAPEPRLRAHRGAGGVVGRRAAPAVGGPAVAWPGGVDVVYDTVGAPGDARGRAPRAPSPGHDRAARALVDGRGASGRRWYFKEVRLIGSNAFGIEEVDGVRQHAIAHYLDLVAAGRIDLAGMLTHTLPPSTTGATRSARSSTRARPAPSRSPSIYAPRRERALHPDLGRLPRRRQPRACTASTSTPPYLDDFDAWREKYRNPFRTCSRHDLRVRNWDDEVRREPAGGRRHGRRGRVPQHGAALLPQLRALRRAAEARGVRAPPRRHPGPQPLARRLLRPRAPSAGPASARSSSTTSTTPSPMPAGSRSTGCGAACSPQHRPRRQLGEAALRPRLRPALGGLRGARHPVNVHGGTGSPDYGAYRGPCRSTGARDPLLLAAAARAAHAVGRVRAAPRPEVRHHRAGLRLGPPSCSSCSTASSRRVAAGRHRRVPLRRRHGCPRTATRVLPPELLGRRQLPAPGRRRRPRRASASTG